MVIRKKIERVKEQVVRGIAVQVFAVSVLAVFTGNMIPVIFLAADFFTRVFISPEYSLTVYISKLFLSSFFRFRERMILYKPKRFAAAIGFGMAAGAVLLGFLGFQQWMRIIIGVLALFSFAEAFLKFCAGCKIFGLFIHFKIIKEEKCVDCVLDSDIR